MSNLSPPLSNSGGSSMRNSQKAHSRTISRSLSVCAPSPPPAASAELDAAEKRSSRRRHKSSPRISLGSAGSNNGAHSNPSQHANASASTGSLAAPGSGSGGNGGGSSLVPPPYASSLHTSNNNHNDNIRIRAGIASSSSNSGHGQASGGGGADQHHASSHTHAHHSACRASISRSESTHNVRGNDKEGELEREREQESMPSYHISGPDAFDAIVQAANPRHPDHAVWVERFGGSLPSRGKLALSDDHAAAVAGESAGEGTAASGSRDSLSAAVVTVTHHAENAVSGSWRRASPSGTRGSRGRRDGEGAFGGGRTAAQQQQSRTRRTSSKTSLQHQGQQQYHSSSVNGGSSNPSNSRARAQDLFYAFPASSSAGRSGHPFGSDQDSDDVRVGTTTTAVGTSATAGASSFAPLFSPENPGPGGHVRCHSMDSRKRRSRKDKDKGKQKATPPPIPPPRVTSSTSFQAPAAVSGSAPGTPISPRAGLAAAMMTDSSSYASTMPPSQSHLSLAGVGRANISSNSHVRMGIAPPASASARARSVDMPRVTQRTSSISSSEAASLFVQPVPEWVEAAGSGMRAHPSKSPLRGLTSGFGIGSGSLPASPRTTSGANAQSEKEHTKKETKRPRSLSLHSVISSKFDAVTSVGVRGANNVGQAFAPASPVPALPQTATTSEAASDYTPSSYSAHSAPGSGSGSGSGPPSSPYAVRALPGTLNGRPTEARHLSTVYQEDTEAADEFFDANEIHDAASDLHARSAENNNSNTDITRHAAPPPLGNANANAKAHADARGNANANVHSNANENVHKHTVSGIAKKEKQKKSIKCSSSPMRDLSDRERRSLLAQNTYYIPPNPASRSPSSSGSPQLLSVDAQHLTSSSTSATAAAGAARGREFLRPTSSSPNLFAMEPGVEGIRANASEAGQSVIGTSSMHSRSHRHDSASGNANTQSQSQLESLKRPSGWRSARFPSFALRKKVHPSLDDSHGQAGAAPSGVGHRFEQTGASEGLVAAPPASEVLKPSKAPPPPKARKVEEASSWRSRFLRGSPGKVNVGSPKSVCKEPSSALTVPDSKPTHTLEADNKWRHDILSEVVTRSLNASNATLATSSPRQQPLPSLLHGASESKDLLTVAAADDILDGPTIRKSLSPHLLSEATAHSRDSTWRSMSSLEDKAGGNQLENETVARVEEKVQQGEGKRIDHGQILLDNSSASPFKDSNVKDVDKVLDLDAEAAMCAIPDDAAAAEVGAHRQALSPLPPPIQALRSRVTSPAEHSRTSFSMDRNRDPVMSPMLWSQQQTTQSRSPGLLGALRERMRSKSPGMAPAVDSSTYRHLGPVLSPESAVAKSPPFVAAEGDRAAPAFPRPIAVAAQASIGLGIKDSEVSETHAASASFAHEGTDTPPKPPPKYSADVRAFDDMLRGFGQAEKQVRQIISGKAREQLDETPSSLQNGTRN
ncbi:hypothetical protein K437DRAFT_34563 [Tilletiaria anomala UBC 951]|uniref:Uncharacterized protein n=1 Tax=Tilletiaria anomala (strain ATCC 24038 / CBS 436.72 / UBC 951) TaxID=1037660 RepID=A0A066WE06_TILAU|nr:uncharacterized protein K437DRAFT_34563 [Tilletiaria anomala UBC 951]KDN52187.1 hypothetical protein K437DRAFT_34563 [Tilletiaria anomala UBC 951]